MAVLAWTHEMDRSLGLRTTSKRVGFYCHLSTRVGHMATAWHSRVQDGERWAAPTMSSCLYFTCLPSGIASQFPCFFFLVRFPLPIQSMCVECIILLQANTYRIIDGEPTKNERRGAGLAGQNDGPSPSSSSSTKLMGLISLLLE